MNKEDVLTTIKEAKIADPYGEIDLAWNRAIDYVLDEVAAPPDIDYDALERIADALERAYPPGGWEYETDVLVDHIDRYPGWNIVNFYINEYGPWWAVLRRPRQASKAEQSNANT